MGNTSPPRRIVSQELNSQRKNAFTSREIVTTSRPVSRSILARRPVTSANTHHLTSAFIAQGK